LTSLTLKFPARPLPNKQTSCLSLLFTELLLGECNSDEADEQAEGDVVVPVHSMKSRKEKKAGREEIYVPSARKFDGIFIHSM